MTLRPRDASGVLQDAWERVRPPRGRELDLVAVGECMVELWAEVPLGQADTFHRRFGGDVLNALVMAARLGDRTGFVTLVGEDAFGPPLRQAWTEEKVDTSRCGSAAANNGLYVISVRPDGERDFWYCRQGSAASLLAPSDVDGTYLAGASVVLLSGVTQAISASAQAATLHAAREAHRHGAVVAFDPNFRPALWAQRVAPGPNRERRALAAARGALDDVAPFIDLFLASAPGDTALWEAEGMEPGAAALAAATRGLGLVGLKCGPDGAYVAARGPSPAGATCLHVPAHRVRAARDTTGAGDAWNAGFLHGLGRGADVVRSARFANRLAAFKIAYRGAVPPRAEVLGRLPSLDDTARQETID